MSNYPFPPMPPLHPRADDASRDECRFHNGGCNIHGLSVPSALCTHAAATLQADRDSAVADHTAACAEWSAAMREIERLAARVLEVEAKTYEQAQLYWRTQHAYDAAEDRVKELERLCDDGEADCMSYATALSRAEARVQELEAEIEEMKDDAKHTAWERDLL